MDKFKVKKTKKGYTISYYRDDNTEDILVIKNYDDLAKLSNLLNKLTNKPNIVTNFEKYQNNIMDLLESGATIETAMHSIWRTKTRAKQHDEYYINEPEIMEWFLGCFEEQLINEKEFEYLSDLKKYYDFEIVKFVENFIIIEKKADFEIVLPKTNGLFEDLTSGVYTLKELGME